MTGDAAGDDLAAEAKAEHYANTKDGDWALCVCGDPHPCVALRLADALTAANERERATRSYIDHLHQHESDLVDKLHAANQRAGDAARAAAWDAAWDAAGAAAGERLAPTREHLQLSALGLLDRLIDPEGARA